MKEKHRKFLAIFWLFTLYPLSFLIPRDQRMWVFGCYRDVFADNAKYLYLWTTLHAKDVRPVWITGSATVLKTLREQGYEVYLRWSWRGVWTCLRSGVYVYASYLEDINFFTSGAALRVNLWHGVGLKKIEFKINEGALRKYYRRTIFNPYRLLLPDKFVRPDVFLSTSPMMTDHFSECFRIDRARCFEASYPRLDIDHDHALQSAALRFGDYGGVQHALSSFSRRIVYMPTWRDSRASGIDVAIRDPHALNASLRKTNSVMVIKAHPNERITALADLSNIMIWPGHLDIYPLLASFEVLVTDYSSILYDFIALGKTEVVLFNYDFGDYTAQSRDFAYPYQENVTGCVVTTFGELCNLLEQPALPVDHKHGEIFQRFWAHPELGCQQIYQHIAESAAAGRSTYRAAA